MTALPKKYYTPEEYLELEEKAAYKSEYFNGHIYPMGDFEGDTPEAMAGANPAHNAIRENLSIEIGSFLKKKACRSFSSDQRVFIPSNGLYTYPDLVVVCGKPEFSDVQTNSLTNPVLIVEVLSQSTANYDRGEKFELFRDIPTFREYLLIDSRRVWAELWRKSNEGIWSLVFEGKSLESLLCLETIGMELPLSDLYVNTGDLPETVFEIR
ncbi:Uma2 family endonuclease [Runella sp. CRIBMP]|uniref:Uma2 family endonuclease n=1 Tax=Runella sp. CRIBMP TaxID=2683261 RepID=UPI001411F3BB|nr:Uma2 family endonuclease [Runella sp. CRIBMP]NBB22853.1 Uma2 family endonuclease [Runella sp. CRIBMP]